MRPATPNIPNGFVLIEILVGMSLILGAWMTSIGAYQSLSLRLGQAESKRSQLRQALDVYELAEKVRRNTPQAMSPNVSNISTKDIKNEPSGVSRRNRTLHSVTQSTVKN